MLANKHMVPCTYTGIPTYIYTIFILIINFQTNFNINVQEYKNTCGCVSVSMYANTGYHSHSVIYNLYLPCCVSCYNTSDDRLFHNNNNTVEIFSMSNILQRSALKFKVVYV